MNERTTNKSFFKDIKKAFQKPVLNSIFLMNISIKLYILCMYFFLIYQNLRHHMYTYSYKICHVILSNFTILNSNQQQSEDKFIQNYEAANEQFILYILLLNVIVRKKDHIPCERDYVKIFTVFKNKYLFYRCTYLEVGTIFMPAIFYIVSTPLLINGVFQKFVDVCQLLG